MMNGNTIDKRRPDLRDELGYIAPPNRKLPPVPGSNYNTCDRVKRGLFMLHLLPRKFSTYTYPVIFFRLLFVDYRVLVYVYMCLIV